MLTSEEKLQRGFRAEDDILVPLPVDSSSDEDEAAADGRHADEDLPSSASVLVEAFLEDVVQRSAAACVGASASLFDLDFWKNEAAQLGLHVMRPDRGSAGALPPSAPLRHSLDRRGYLQSPTLFPGDADEATLSALRRMLARLKQLGFAPGFLYVFDEAWLVIERCMRLLGDVLVPEAGTGRGEQAASRAPRQEPSSTLPEALPVGVQQLVLEPSVFAHALEKPASAEDTDEERRREAASQDASEIARHSYLGGNFGAPRPLLLRLSGTLSEPLSEPPIGLPHRDHSSSDCFDAASGEPVLLSLWCPLTRVTADNGCMFVLPKDRDPLLHQPRHPHHLRPFDASSGTLRFGLGGAVASPRNDVSHEPPRSLLGASPAGAVALAPCDAGCALAWHRSATGVRTCTLP